MNNECDFELLRKEVLSDPVAKAAYLKNNRLRHSKSRYSVFVYSVLLASFIILFICLYNC